MDIENGTSVNKVDRKELLASLAEDIATTQNHTGPGAASRLYDAGLTFEEALAVLRKTGFEVYPSNESNKMNVSVERFDGSTPVPAHYKSMTVSFNPEDERPHWLSELE